MKYVSKNNKFSSCFRPVVDIDAMLDSRAAVHRPSTRRFTCIPVPVPHKHHIQISDTKSVFLDKTGDSVMHHPPKRTLSLLIKAVVVQSILNRRGSRESRNKSKRSYWGKESVDNNSKKTKAESLLSVSSSPVLASANSWESQSIEAKEKESKNEGRPEKQKRLRCFGTYLLLMSLTFTALWDRYWGVVLTSTCLYLFCVWEAKYRICNRKPIRGGSIVKSRVQSQEKNRGRGHNERC